MRHEAGSRTGIHPSTRTELRNTAKKAALALVYKLPPFPRYLQGKLIWVHPRAQFSVSTKTFFQGEAHVRAWLIAQLKPGYVFFDVGAHHGWMALWSLPLVGSEGAVYSFEPSPANVSVLEWHRKANKASNWTIVPKAIAEEDALARQFCLIDSGDSPMNSLTTGTADTPLMSGRNIRNISVQTITLDGFCREVDVRPQVVKIDVEGAELLALRGATTLLGESSPAVILAVHPYWMPKGQSPTQLVELLMSFGYSLFNSEGNPVMSLRGGEYLCLKV
jgi:FkbM family methyltransferase